MACAAGVNNLIIYPRDGDLLKLRGAMGIAWPNKHQFAFTILDDTDWATVANVKPMYDLLATLGMRTTKSTWVFGGGENPLNQGMTCEDPAYREWLLNLQAQGFEIGLHNVAAGTSKRERIDQGLDIYRSLFGDENAVYSNHVGCLDNIYWGQYRVSAWRRKLYNLLTRGQHRYMSYGHKQKSHYFWGDLCQQYIRYVRNFVFNDLNALNVCPEMPYYDPKRPFVNFWFVSTDAGKVENFLNRFTRENIDQLVQQGGLCIAYVHFARGFVHDKQVHPRVRKSLEYIAAQNGWFAPVSTVLDFLRKEQTKEERTISTDRLSQLETRWLLNKMRYGPS
ncbi:MAG: hypothetical protein NT075_06845 [Chloroflexi bacterium]|nr:hypothetical protein [Chloroflexota bacterium]